VTLIVPKIALVAVLASLALVQHVSAAPAWAPLQAQFLVHSGHATYAEAPTRTQRAVTIAFEGKPAKEVFDQMGPDAKTQCSADKGDRERRTKGATCTYTAKLENPSSPHYRCWIGINLRTGDGDHGVSC
jgi:uncharacterized protein (DUF1330 family)